MSDTRRTREERRKELKVIRGVRTEPTRRERERRKEFEAVREKSGPPEVLEREAQEDIERAEEALKQAESLKQEYGNIVTWGTQTYDLGTTQGYKAYRQALRERRSEIQAAKRGLKEYRFAAIRSRAPQPFTDTRLPYTKAEVRETGPPRIASTADLKRLKSQGYELPEDRTIYISPSGEVYYYENEPEDSPMALSRRLWVKAMATPEAETRRFLGVPYSVKGVRQIGAVLAGAAERATTPVTGLIPGEQPFEIMPGEDTFTLYDLAAADELSEAEKRVALATGVTAEAALTVGVSYAAGYAGGAVIGASGALVSRIPIAGPALERGGAYVAGKLSTPLGGALLLGGVAAVEAPRVIDLVKEDKAIGYELLMEASRFAGGTVGVTRGLAFGKTLPARAERAFLGGVTVPEEAIVPSYVTEEGGFPRFSEEPYKPTAAGYREMAEAYTPPELRVTKEGVPSFHATAGRLVGESPEGFVTQVGKRPGEAGMFYAPAASKHFLRLEGGYTLRPGVPNIFAEPQLVYGEFPGVTATGLGKRSPELAKLLAKSPGKLLMPAEQLVEAQAVLGPGTEMARVVKGRFWADIGGKPVKIERFLPKGAFPDISTKGVESLERLMAKSSLSTPIPTTYVPFLSPAAAKETKSLESEMRRVSATMSKASSFTVPSMVPSVPSKLGIPGITSTTTRGQPSKPSRGRPSPSIPTPSIEYPSPSEPGYGPTTPSPTPFEPSIGLPTLPETPSYPTPEYPSGIVEPTRKRGKKGRKKRRGVAERRLAPVKITFPMVKVPEIKTPEFKVKVPKI